VRIPKLKFLVVRAIKVLLVGCVLVFSVSIYAHKIEPNWLDVTTTEIKLPNLERAFDGYRIVQITDLHAGDAIVLN
jgi:uncharacterized protein